MSFVQIVVQRGVVQSCPAAQPLELVAEVPRGLCQLTRGPCKAHDSMFALRSLVNECRRGLQ